jgi:hypothetical protein
MPPLLILFIVALPFLVFSTTGSKTIKANRSKKNLAAFHLFCNQVERRIKKADDPFRLWVQFNNDRYDLDQYRRKIHHSEWNKSLTEIWALYLNKHSELLNQTQCKK